ncbi:uncharacterized protein LOC127257475 [Andrographis paniculata]|uniref:uncharacterized protein LOC127257475 n=1 Tax=Andrographis paniculata TaxID=175694 RepID=UPI0021E861E5|nr:uncharacterized protein LOC127257475 [Andrographis paniculata]
MVMPVKCGCSSWWRRKVKEDKKSTTQCSESVKTVLHVEVKKSTESNNSIPTSLAVPVPFPFVGSSRYMVEVTSHDSSPIAAHTEEEEEDGNPVHFSDDDNNLNDTIVSDHLSDPGGWKAEFWASPELKRSCSDLALTSMYQGLDDDEELPYKEKMRYTKLHGPRIPVGEDATSPVSITTRCSADNVILKKHSSSQILPSRSRKLWWKLFLWSHRNLHKKPQPIQVKPSAHDQQGGYHSDSIEPTKAVDSSTLRDNGDDHGRGWFYRGSDEWPHNQWIAFPANSSSPLERVSEWIAESSKHPPSQGDDENPIDRGNDTSLIRDSHRSAQLPVDVLHANYVIRSLNHNSSVAHMTGIGLKVIPQISRFVSLRAVHLSGNFIAHIAPGSLPKALHILNLSKNKIATIEGLRELTRLRVLDLSYNRISTIGQGLSNCGMIKELSLAGNKISNVEGLHRLLKLAELDLSFNRITTARALGQLVANYGSLISVNLLGNPIQSNSSNDQLRRAVCSLLPKLALLNRQPVNDQKAHEIGAAKAVLGSNNSSWSMRRGNSGGRRSSRRSSSHGGSSSSPALKSKRRLKTQGSRSGIMHQRASLDIK